MADELKPRTASINGNLWGAHARDWAEIQEGQCRAVYLAAFDRADLGPTTTYLDVGCGAGMAAQIAAERGAKVAGLDASPPLLAIARERVRTAEFLVGELENLPFPDNTFDFVTGFNSLQYAGNPTIALKETKRVAKPGALVLIMTWGEPAGMQAAALVAALRPLMPAPPAGAPGPFALSDESALRAFAAAAGLEPIEIFDVASPWKYESLEVALRGLRSSGVAARAAANSSEESVNAAHEAALQPFRNADQGFVIQASFRCLLARA